MFSFLGPIRSALSKRAAVMGPTDAGDSHFARVPSSFAHERAMTDLQQRRLAEMYAAELRFRHEWEFRTRRRQRMVLMSIVALLLVAGAALLVRSGNSLLAILPVATSLLAGFAVSAWAYSERRLRHVLRTVEEDQLSPSLMQLEETLLAQRRSARLTASGATRELEHAAK